MSPTSIAEPSAVAKRTPLDIFERIVHLSDLVVIRTFNQIRLLVLLTHRVELLH